MTHKADTMGSRTGTSITELPIYLAGSYHGFRDSIIKALPDCIFKDPRIHRQSSCAKLIVDDLNQAANSPVLLGIFPKGKSRGTTTYAEIGVAYANRNHRIIIDEDRGDPVLKDIADSYFDSIDDAIDYLKTNPDIEINRQKPVSKYPEGTTDAIPIEQVLIAGEQTPIIHLLIERAQALRPDRTFMYAYDPFDAAKHMSETDLLVAYFPATGQWDRHACLLMGAAYAHDISTFIVDEHDFQYPTLQAIARRQGSLSNAIDYMTKVDDLNIDREAKVLYEMFTKQAKACKKKSDETRIRHAAFLSRDRISGEE